MERSVWILYPEYFDYNLSRRLGRKVPLALATPSPTLEELTEAVRKTKLPIVRVEYKSHPAYWIGRRGRVVVPKVRNMSKRNLLFIIAKNLRLVRKKAVTKEKEATKKKTSDVERYLQRVLGGEKKSKKRRK